MVGILHQALVATYSPLPKLTQKGYGTAATASDSSPLTVNYSTVLGGAAPEAGDLLCAICFAYDNSGSPIQNITGTGWAQSTLFGSYAGTTIIAKILTADDISSPPTIVTGPTLGASLLWVAYSVGMVPTIASSSISQQISGGPAPANQSSNSSALTDPDAAIVLSVASGSDSSIQSNWSGATPDINVYVNQSFYVQVRFMCALIVGGANVTVSKGDDGGVNGLAIGYISATW